MISCLSATKHLFAWRMSTTGPHDLSEWISVRGWRDFRGWVQELVRARAPPAMSHPSPNSPGRVQVFFKQINIQRGYLSSCSSQGRFQTSTKDSMPPILGFIHIKHVLIIKLCWSGLVMWTWMFFWDWPLATVTEYSSKSANTQTILVWYSDNTLMIQTQVERFTSPASESFTSIDDNNRKINS